MKRVIYTDLSVNAKVFVPQNKTISKLSPKAKEFVPLKDSNSRYKIKKNK